MRSAFTQLYESYSTGTMVTIDLSKATFSDNKVPDSAFKNCINLEGVSLPSSITEIGKDAFYYTNISSISIPSNVTSIGASAFECKSVTNINYKDNSQCTETQWKSIEFGSNWRGTGVSQLPITATVTFYGGTSKTLEELDTY